jgi:SecD/SecF fusion protein
MSRSLQLKILVLVFLLGWAVYELIPTFQYWPLDKTGRSELKVKDKARFDMLESEAIKRGLDLQGGVYLVLEVDPRRKMDGGELSDAVEGARRVIEQRVNQYGVSEANVQKIGDRRIIIELPGLEDIESAKRLVGRTALLKFSLLRPVKERDEVIRRIDSELAGLLGSLPTTDSTLIPSAMTPAVTPAEAPSTSTGGLFEPSESGEFEPKTATETPAETVAEESGNPLAGITSFQALLQDAGNGDLLVTNENRPKVEALLTLIKEKKPGLLLHTGIFLFGKEQNYGAQTLYPMFYVATKPEMTGASVKDARVGKGSGADIAQAGKFIINFEVKADSVRLFSSITRRNRGERLCIVLDDLVYSAPTIQAHILDGRSIITGMENADEARSLAIAIRSGALPAEVEAQEQRYVGPSLGSDSIAKSETAMTIGGVVLLLLILVYYRTAGAVAIAGLVINMTLLMACLAGLHGTLTLPGVAGLILTVGMAVDANVLIFERIREELSTGKTARAAIEAGYERASTAIWDANITTFITAAVLYQFGSGPVRGFALILGIGIFTSVFSALFVTRLIYEMWQAAKPIGTFAIGTALLKHPSINFLGQRFKTTVGSGVALAAGVVTIIVIGFNWGVDFSGGTRLEIRFSKAVSIGEVRSAMKDLPVDGKTVDLTTSEIKTADRGTDILITVKQFPDVESTAIDEALRARLAERFAGNLTGDWLLNSEVVGPKVGSEMKIAAFYSVLFALIGILIYISIRFEWMFAVAATLALFHDVLFTLGVFSMIDHEITLPVVAAVLTIVGYSLNDTIVVFDRIREGLHSYKNMSYMEILNRCINETLSRTLITSITTLVVVLALLIFGGEVLFDFALALVIGIAVGTYSSVFIAAAVLLVWQNYHEKQTAIAARVKAEASALKRGKKKSRA